MLQPHISAWEWCDLDDFFKALNAFNFDGYFPVENKLNKEQEAWVTEIIYGKKLTFYYRKEIGKNEVASLTETFVS